MVESTPAAAENFTTTAISGGALTSSNLIDKEADAPNLEGVAFNVRSLYRDYKDARRAKEDTWLESWAAYTGTPEALDHLRKNVANIVGDVNNDWRHRINVGKAYEIVETVNAYLQTAFFPNSEWFGLIPREPGLEQVAKLTRKYMEKKLKTARFKSYWEMYTRQLLITGFSVLALPWERSVRQRPVRTKKVEVVESLLGDVAEQTTYPVEKREHVEYDNLKLQVVDSFDCFIDPNEPDINRANFIRRMSKRKAEVMRDIANGVYPYLDPMSVVSAGNGPVEDTHKKTVSYFLGVRYDPEELVEVLEFWGDLTVDDLVYHDVVATVVGNSIARFEPNPYWGGKPFVIGTCIPIPTKSYGLGVLEPVLGMLHELNILTNQRLDNLELAVDTMWGFVNDGIVNPDDIYTRPGGIVEMAEPGNVFPLQRDTTFTVSYNEAAVQEQNIDKAVGVGAYIGTQQGRKGERVTAKEIQAVRDAGGNRLSSIHGHIEQTQLHTLLVKLFRLCQQFVETDEVVRLPGEAPNSVMYVEFGPQELMYDYDIEPVGSEYVANQEKELAKVMNFIDLAAQIPQFNERVDWDSLLRMTIRKFGFKEEIDSFIKQAQTPPAVAPEQAQDPAMAGDMAQMQQAAQALFASGGKPAINAMQAEVAMKGVEGAVADAIPRPPL